MAWVACVVVAAMDVAELVECLLVIFDIRECCVLAVQCSSMYSFVFKISEKVMYKSGSNFLGFKLKQCQDW